MSDPIRDELNCLKLQESQADREWERWRNPQLPRDWGALGEAKLQAFTFGQAGTLNFRNGGQFVGGFGIDAVVSYRPLNSRVSVEAGATYVYERNLSVRNAHVALSTEWHNVMGRLGAMFYPFYREPYSLGVVTRLGASYQKNEIDVFSAAMAASGRLESIGFVGELALRGQANVGVVNLMLEAGFVTHPVDGARKVEPFYGGRDERGDVGFFGRAGFGLFF